MTHLEKGFWFFVIWINYCVETFFVFALNLLWMTSRGRRAYCSHKPQKKKLPDRSFCRVTRIFDWLQTFAQDKGGISLMLLCLVIHSDIMCCHKSNETQRAERERERRREGERELHHDDSTSPGCMEYKDVWKLTAAICIMPLYIAVVPVVCAIQGWRGVISFCIVKSSCFLRNLALRACYKQTHIQWEHFREWAIFECVGIKKISFILRLLLAVNHLTGFFWNEN